MLRQQTSAAAHLCESLPGGLVAVREQLSRFPKNDVGHVPSRRFLTTALVDLFLGLDRNGLIGRESVNGEKAR